MRIEVDTKHDSKEDIKKVIQILSHLVSDHAVFDAGIRANMHNEKQEEKKTPFEPSTGGMSMFDFSSGSSESSSPQASGQSSQEPLDSMYASESYEEKKSKKDFDFDFKDIISY